jgi:hypothetical protein
MTEPFLVTTIMFLYIEGCGPQGIGFTVSAHLDRMPSAAKVYLNLAALR